MIFSFLNRIIIEKYVIAHIIIDISCQYGDSLIKESNDDIINNARQPVNSGIRFFIVLNIDNLMVMNINNMFSAICQIRINERVI